MTGFKGTIVKKLETVRRLIESRCYFGIFHRLLESLIPEHVLSAGKTTMIVYHGSEDPTPRFLPKGAMFREGQPNDLDNLVRELGLSHRRQLFQGYFRQGHKCYLVEYQGKAAGVIWAFLGETQLTFDGYRQSRIRVALDSGTAFLGDAFVLDAYRLRGFYPVLLGGTIRSLIQNEGCARITGHVYYENALSLSSHLRFGYKVHRTVYFAHFLGRGCLVCAGGNRRIRIQRINAAHPIRLLSMM